LSPAVISSWAPTAGPTPLMAIRAGLARVARRSIRSSSVGDLVLEGEVASRQGPQRVQGVGVVDVMDLIGAAIPKGGNEFGLRQVPVTVPQGGAGVDQQGADLTPGGLL
jgi:hypothetical protein